MYVWYVSQHLHNIILGVFGYVLKAFGSVLESFGASGIALERLNAFWSVSRPYGSIWQARQARQAG